MAETHQPREQKQQHLLMVVYPIQSHINPSLLLAKSLTRLLGVRVTFSTAVSGHRRMFPDCPTSLPVQDPSDPLLSFYPHSDGYDDGYTTGDANNFLSTSKAAGTETLHALAIAPGRPPVTCILYALLFPWVVDVADRLGVPSFLYWIQSAVTFVAYHHYFHSHRERFRSVANDPSLVLELPGLPPLRRRELPSFFVGGGLADDTTKEVLLSLFEGTFKVLEKGTTGDAKPRVIVNTFDALERGAIEAMYEAVELIPIGPVLPAVCVGRSDRKEATMFGREVVKEAVVDGDAKEEYLGWLDQWPERSVVYLSFGSISILGRKQREEFACALVECGRPFLWVAREERDGVEAAEGVERGKVVGWCNQVEVLAHRAVGCFVTHHGWNSTLEAICCGVPMVGLPQWSDQPTNARLVEGSWRVGMRAEVNGEGVVERTELKRCLEAVMGGGEEAVEIRKRAEMWKEKAREAAKEGGPSDQNLKAFVEGVACPGV